jgi:hypothetical protein
MSELNDFVGLIAGLLASNDDMRAALAVHSRDPLNVDEWQLPGLLGVLPLWADDSWAFGLMAVPDRNVEDWPGVMVWHEQAISISTNSATLLPRFLIARHLSNFPDEACSLKQNWNAIKAPLEALHAALGGHTDALNHLAEVVADDITRKRFNFSASNDQDFEAAHEALFRAIDISPEFTAFANWFSAEMSGERRPVDSESFGNWGRQALAWSLQFDVARGTLGSDFSSLTPLVAGQNGWDTGISVAPSWHDTGSGGSLAFGTMAAQLIDAGPELADPTDQRLVHAIAEAGTAYNGMAHAKLVPFLDEQGQADRAWSALCGAAWWTQMSRGEIAPAIFDGARLLCDRHGWDDIRWVLDHNASNRK